MPSVARVLAPGRVPVCARAEGPGGVAHGQAALPLSVSLRPDPLLLRPFCPPFLLRRERPLWD